MTGQQSMPCPYCGGIGHHVWSGGGACPGLDKDAEIERLQAEIQRMRDQAIKLRDMAAAFAETLERRIPVTEDFVEELRKAAE